MGTVTNRRIQIYPALRALQYLGASRRGELGGTLTLAVEAFADVVAKATKDNESVFSRAEWNAIADANNGMGPAVLTGSSPQMLLWPNVEDAHRLEGLGLKWLSKDLAEADRLAAELVAKLRGLDAVHAWAVVWSVMRFWARSEVINHQVDEWWTLAARLSDSEPADADAGDE